MAKNHTETVSEAVDSNTRTHYEADLDQALSVAGIGCYNIKYSLVLALFLISCIIEPFGYSYILPAAKCDLQMTNAQRGVIGSIPYIGIVVTSFPWGYLVDTRGRRKMVVYSSTAAGVFGVIAAFMPDVTSFIIFKLLSSLCIACPAAVPYTFISEIMPPRYKDITLSIVNAMQISGAALVPLLAWVFLPFNFKINFGLYDFRPWRLLTLIYSLFFIISAILMSFGPESPKYLISQGKHDEALQVLKIIYAGNKRKSLESYPVKRLKMLDDIHKEKLTFLNSFVIQTRSLLKSPYLKWLALNGILFFGVFATGNGLYMWLPDVLNRVLTGSGHGGVTACEVIAQRFNETASDSAVCDDSIEPTTFIINTIANFTCAFIALVVSGTVKLIGKKTLLILVFIVIGMFCILINFVTQTILFAILLSSVPLLALAIGPINAYSVEIFPTNLRGMAISITMMVGRFGSIVGSNVAGALINASCEATFYLFSSSLIVCGLLSFLLPRSKGSTKKQNLQKMTHL